MSKPFLTIGIPTFNRKEAINANIHDLIDNLKSEDIGILVIDNNSQDGTYNVLEPFRRYKTFELKKNNANLGYNGNFLKIIENTKSEYLLFTSDEDFIQANNLQYLLEFLHQREPDFVSTQFFLPGHHKMYRGKKQNQRIKVRDYQMSSFYLSGLVYKVKAAQKIIESNRELLLNPSQIYPQVLISSVLVSKGNCFWLNKSVAQKKYNLETNINHSGRKRYDFIDSRWEQHKLLTEYIIFWLNQSLKEVEYKRLNQLLTFHNRSLMYKLSNAIFLEAPEMKKDYVFGGFFWLMKYVLRNIFNHRGYLKTMFL